MGPGIVPAGNVACLLQRGIQRLAAMQDKLYAQDQWGVLLVFQAMDAAGISVTPNPIESGIYYGTVLDKEAHGVGDGQGRGDADDIVLNGSFSSKIFGEFAGWVVERPE